MFSKYLGKKWYYFFNTFVGLPTTIEFSVTFSITTEPIPTVLHFSIVTLSLIDAFIPMYPPSLTFTNAPILALFAT